MDGIYDSLFASMQNTVDDLAHRVPAPRLTRTPSGLGFRYVERSPQQAIVQKLARLVSTLCATRLLLDHGFVQEVGALKRILDEIQEDVLFLVCGLGDPSPLHQRFLKDFYEEEFDAETAIESTQKRGMVPRRKIRAHIAREVSRVPGSTLNPSQVGENSRTMSKAYSGYVHAASPQSMEMYGGNPPRFHMAGMLGTPLARGHEAEFKNYVYRSICAFSVAAKALGDDAGSAKIRRAARWFDKSFLVNGPKPRARRRVHVEKEGSI